MAGSLPRTRTSRCCGRCRPTICTSSRVRWRTAMRVRRPGMLGRTRRQATGLTTRLLTGHIPRRRMRNSPARSTRGRLSRTSPMTHPCPRTTGPCRNRGTWRSHLLRNSLCRPSSLANRGLGERRLSSVCCNSDSSARFTCSILVCGKLTRTDRSNATERGTTRTMRFAMCGEMLEGCSETPRGTTSLAKT